MSRFTEKLNAQTNNRFESLRLKSVSYSLRNRSFTFVFLYPEAMETPDAEFTAGLESAAIKAAGINAKLSVKLVSAHFDDGFFKKDIITFFKSFPSIGSALTEKDIAVTYGEDGKKSAAVFLEPYIYDYALERGLINDVNEYLNRSYCEDIEFRFEPKIRADDDKDFDFYGDTVKMELEDSGGRTIAVENVDSLLGLPIYDKAVYIEDAVFTGPCVVCGTVTKIYEHSYRNKKGEDSVLFKLTLEDFTGIKECLYFAPKSNIEKMRLLKEGKGVVIRGNIEPDKRTEGVNTFFIKEVSYCTLPKNFKLNRLKRKVADEYMTVFPQKYTGKYQASIFDDTGTKKMPDFFMGKEIVVFDTETTGLDPKNDRIVELAAVKIIDGKIAETFSSLVNPKRPIPEAAFKVHGITDATVKNAPAIEDVLPDFYKFSDSAALCAHNVQFDIAFISAAGKPLGIYFDNELYDTVALSRKAYPGLPHYNLGALCERFNIDLTQAHRALADTIACAELLLKIFE